MKDNMLALAIHTAAHAHLNQVDKQGKPYILHPLWVMDKVRHLGEDCMIVAVLHDLVEDTPWTIDMLRVEGYSEEILLSLSLLDMREGDYMDNIDKILENHYATQVKLRDLEHNSKITRLKEITDDDVKRIRKYNAAYTILKPFRV